MHRLSPGLALWHSAGAWQQPTCSLTHWRLRQESQQCHLHSGCEERACQEKSAPALHVLPQRQGLEDTISDQLHLPPATRPWSWVTIRPGSQCFASQVVTIVITCLPHLIIRALMDFIFRVFSHPWQDMATRCQEKAIIITDLRTKSGMLFQASVLIKVVISNLYTMLSNTCTHRNI